MVEARRVSMSSMLAASSKTPSVDSHTPGRSATALDAVMTVDKNDATTGRVPESFAGPGSCQAFHDDQISSPEATFLGEDVTMSDAELTGKVNGKAKRHRQRKSKRARRRMREKKLQQMQQNGQLNQNSLNGQVVKTNSQISSVIGSPSMAQSMADEWTRRLVELFPVSEAVNVTIGNLVPLRPEELKTVLRKGAVDFSQSQLELIETILRAGLDQIQEIKIEKARALEREKVREEIRLELQRQFR